MCNNCNPCDNCAPKCQECCNPNIQWDWCVTVDQSEEGVITISAPCPTEVTSDDWTIGVTEKEPHEWYSKRFDLTVNKEDRLVAACWNDWYPGTLDVKLEEWHWIDISTVNCWWWGDAKLRIEVDENELNIPNNKVAIDAWCTPWYLNDVLISSSDKIELVPIGNCKLAIKDRADPIVAGKCVLTQSRHWEISWWQDWFAYYLAGSDYKWANEWWLMASLARPIKHNVEESWWWMKILKNGLYQVSFSMSVEVSFWIHWMRWWLFVMKHWTTGKECIIESRFAAPIWRTPYELSYWEDPDYNGSLMALQTEAQWWDWTSASLWVSLQRMWCSWYTLVDLEEWDILFLWVKWQTLTQYLNWKTFNWDQWLWYVAILWTNWSWNVWDAWAQITAYKVY